MNTFPVWVPGIPSSYSNPPRETVWKQALAEWIPLAAPTIPGQGITAGFVLRPSDWSRKGNDLDNFCEPLFSVLINTKHWVGGRRRNLAWYRVSKRAGEHPGCRVEVFENPAPMFEPTMRMRILDGLYTGDFPQNARDRVLADWVASTSPGSGLCDRYAVLLQFKTSLLNIGDIATGRVKAVLDSLHPVFGGNTKEPGDWRISMLQVEKGVPLPEGDLRLAIRGE